MRLLYSLVSRGWQMGPRKWTGAVWRGERRGRGRRRLGEGELEERGIKGGRRKNHLEVIVVLTF